MSSRPRVSGASPRLSPSGVSRSGGWIPRVAWLCLVLLHRPVAAGVEPVPEEPWFAGSSRDLPAPKGDGCDYLLGDWGGRRSRLEEQGCTISVGYVGEVIANVGGGLRRGAVVEGLALASVDLDLARLVGWQGGTFRLGGLSPHGESPTVKLAGDLQALSNIDTFRDDPSPYEIWLEQKFGHDRFSLRAGLLVADSEFVFNDSSGDLLNSGFGWPSGISFNTLSTGPAFFRSGLGARLRFEPGDDWYLQAGAYDGDTFNGDPLNEGPLDFRLGGDEGIFGITEIGKAWNTSTNAPGLPGEASLGGWLHTADFHEHRDPVRLPDSRVGGVLFIGEQMVWRADREPRESAPAVTAFLRLGWSPAETGVADWSGDAGLRCTGLLPAHFHDALSTGVTWVRLSRDFRDETRVAGAGDFREAELAFEVTWSVTVARGLVLQPDYQWIHGVGGGEIPHDAHIVGLRTRLSF